MYQPDPKPAKRTKQRRVLPKPLVLEVFIRDGYQCQYCGRIFPPRDHNLDCPLHAHHVKHVSQGGKDTLDNLNTCCGECHSNHGWVTKMDKERENEN